MDDIDLLHSATPDMIALCTPSRETWWRWKTGKVRVPTAVINLLRLIIERRILYAGPEWDGWHFMRGKLVDPLNREHTPQSITAWDVIAQRLQAMRATENRLAGELPGNVVLLGSARRAHALTDELQARLERRR